MFAVPSFSHATTVLLFGCALTSAAGAQTPTRARPCGSWFSVSATIARIDPRNGTVKIIDAKGVERPGSVNAVVCSGETVKVEKGTSVVLYEAGTNRSLSGGNGAASEYVAGGSPAIVDAIGNYVASVLSLVTSVDTPQPEARPLNARGGASEQATTEAFRPIAALRGLPLQQLTRDVTPSLGWRGGAGPYRCVVSSAAGEVVWKSPFLAVDTCTLAKVANGVSVVLEDSSKAQFRLNLRPVEWNGVPRPEWLPPGTARPTPAELAAWAIWLWRSGGPEWRLQSLGMLRGAAGTHWLARNFLDQILNETPLVPPSKERERRSR